MTDDPTPEERAQDEPAEDARHEARRRRRLAEIFGDVIPEQTSDDDASRDGRAEERAQEDWLRRQVPPHHG